MNTYGWLIVSQSKTTSCSVRANSKILSISACTSARHVERLQLHGKMIDDVAAIESRCAYLLDRSMIARLEGLFIRDLLANDISA